MDVAASGPTDEELRAAARRIPLVQSTVAEWAKRHSAEQLSGALAEALSSAGVHAATVLAVAATSRGALLDSEVVRRLLPEVDSIMLFGPLVFATGGDRVELLLRFLDDGAGAWEREALAILLATDQPFAERPPHRLVTHARRLARKNLGRSAALVFGAGASRLGDPHLDALAPRYIELGRREAAVVASTLEAARRAPLDALPTAAPPRISSGYTIRNEGPSVGRNDACPCGSGKKYKKCCAGKVTEISAEPPPIDPALLTWEQVGDLRPSVIVELDPLRLSRRARIEGFRKLISYRRWSAAEHFLDAIRAESGEEDAEDWREELIDGAIEQRAYDVVERHVAKLPAERHNRRLQIRTACIRRPPDLLDQLHDHARRALEEERGDTMMSLAFAMLDYLPALGILVARGALTNERHLDSLTLLTSMEEARDELGIAPFEPWWDVWEQITDHRDRSGMTASERENVEKISSELRRARVKADEAAAEAAYLQRRLETLEAAIPAPLPPEAAGARAMPDATTDTATRAKDLEAQRGRLRTKVEELQRIVSEGQEERRELRQRLAAAAKQSSQPPVSDAPAASDGDDDDDRGEAFQRPRRVLVPAFAPRASKAIADLPAETAEVVLVLVAELAAGRENTWSGVKQLRVRQFLSARAGIHYRVLFSVGEGALDVAHVTHRRDLEQAIASLE